MCSTLRPRCLFALSSLLLMFGNWLAFLFANMLLARAWSPRNIAILIIGITVCCGLLSCLVCIEGYRKSSEERRLTQRRIAVNAGITRIPPQWRSTPIYISRANRIPIPTTIIEETEEMETVDAVEEIRAMEEGKDEKEEEREDDITTVHVFEFKENP